MVSEKCMMWNIPSKGIDGKFGQGFAELMARASKSSIRESCFGGNLGKPSPHQPIIYKNTPLKVLGAGMVVLLAASGFGAALGPSDYSPAGNKSDLRSLGLYPFPPGVFGPAIYMALEQQGHIPERYILEALRRGPEIVKEAPPEVIEAAPPKIDCRDDPFGSSCRKGYTCAIAFTDISPSEFEELAKKYGSEIDSSLGWNCSASCKEADKGCIPSDQKTRQYFQKILWEEFGVPRIIQKGEIDGISEKSKKADALKRPQKEYIYQIGGRGSRLNIGVGANGYKFRPESSNPYFFLEIENRLGSDVEIDYCRISCLGEGFEKAELRQEGAKEDNRLNTSKEMGFRWEIYPKKSGIYPEEQYVFADFAYTASFEAQAGTSSIRHGPLEIKVTREKEAVERKGGEARYAYTLKFENTGQGILELEKAEILRGGEFGSAELLGPYAKGESREYTLIGGSGGVPIGIKYAYADRAGRAYIIT
jgi:hypothetical protein